MGSGERGEERDKRGVGQRSPTFLAPGTSFVEDNFSTCLGGRMVQAVMRVMGSDGERQMTLHSLTAHLLLCGPVPNRLQTAIGPWPRGWGPLG